MAKDKNSIIIYTDTIHIIKKLIEKDREEKTNNAGELFYHILQYTNDLNPTPINDIVDLSFEPLKHQFKRDLIKYEKTCKKNKDNANKRWNAKNATGKNGKRPDAKDADSDNGSDSDINNNSLSIFDVFRKKYPGSKNGNETEFKNFQKKHKDWNEVLPSLEKVIDNQIAYRLVKSKNKEFVPEWKNLQTWINKRCWEEEISIAQTNTFNSIPAYHAS